jgi:hypothetical protein
MGSNMLKEYIPITGGWIKCFHQDALFKMAEKGLRSGAWLNGMLLFSSYI